jgi:hypothetical protein
MIPLVFFTLLGIAFCVVCFLIATDKSRFLAHFALHQWRETYYLRALPNFLQSLHDHHFSSAWPASHNALSAFFFARRAKPLLKHRPAHLRRALLQQHITLFALLEILRPFLDDYLHGEQQRIARRCVRQMEDTIERDRLLAFIDYLGQERASFHASRTPAERVTLELIDERSFIATLRVSHAIFQEHGFSLLPAFTQLRCWEEMTGADLVLDLPAIPMNRRPKPRRTVARDS